MGNNIKSNLHEVSFYIGIGSPSSSLIDFPIYKQFEYCCKLDNHQLPFSSISAFLEQLQGHSLAKINIIGGNIFNYQKLSFLINELGKVNADNLLFSHYHDIPNNFKEFKFLIDGQLGLKILVDFPIQFTKFKNVVSLLKSSGIDIEWLFAVKSLKEFEETEVLIDQFQLTNLEIKPTYIGSNLDFFKKNIYLTEDDLSFSKLSRREIFANQVLNTSDFGKLTIMADGNIYANVNQQPLGTIEGNVLEMISKEMIEGKSWRRTRNQEPCNQCVYQWICPSPSNYELVIEKSNLCNISMNSCIN